MRTLNAIITWSVGAVLALVLIWLTGAVAIPFLQARAALRHLDGHVCCYRWLIMTPSSEAAVVMRRLGGPSGAAYRLGVYLRMPKRLANRKPVAALLLASCGKPAVPALTRALADPDKDLRVSAAYALGGIGDDASDAIPGLLAALADTDQDLRRAAAGALGRIPEALVLLACALRSGDRQPGWSAAGALAEIGKPALPALVEALDHPEAEVRGRSAWALGRAEAMPDETAQALVECLADPDEAVRCQAAVALRRFRPVPVLAEALTRPEPAIRLFAATELGGLGPRAGKALAALTAALGDPEWDVRSHAAWALGQLGPEAAEAIPALHKALGDSHWNVRNDAALALERFGETNRPADSASCSAAAPRP